MRIKDILEEKGDEVVTIGAEESIHAAIVMLNQHGIGSLIVTGEGGQIAGIVTERDILVIGVPEDDLNYAMGVMTKHHIRHLPVLDNGRLAGIISIGDLVNAHFEENVFESRTLKDYIHAWGRSH